MKSNRGRAGKRGNSGLGGNNKGSGSSGGKKPPVGINRPRPTPSSSGWNPLALFLVVILVAGAAFAAKYFTENTSSPPSSQNICSAGFDKSRIVKALSANGAINVQLSITSKGEDDREEVMPVKFISTSNKDTGDSLKASANMAAVMTGLILGKDLSDCKFSIEPKADGFFDGPSAGALFTVGFISMIQNDSLYPQVTMTGTINPDTTIGLVGDIPEKLVSADRLREKENLGKIMVLIPFQKADKVEETDAGLRDLDVDTVFDIYKAYNSMTGKQLPKYKSKNINLEDDLQIPKESSDRLDGQVRLLSSEYDSDMPADVDVSPKLDPSALKNLKILFLQTKELHDQYKAYYGQGKSGLSSAYNRISIARTGAFFTKTLKDFSNKIVSLIDRKSGQSDVDIEKEFNDFVNTKVIALNRKKFTDHQLTLEKVKMDIIPIAAAIDIYSQNATADLLLKYSENTSYEINPSTIEKWTLGKIILPGMSDYYTSNSKSSMNLGQTESSEEVPISGSKKTQLLKIAKILGRSASVNLKYLETYLQSKNRQDLGYFLAYAHKQSSERLIKKLNKLNQDNANVLDIYDAIGSATSSFLNSSLLIHKYYSLGAETDFLGGITSNSLNPSSKEFLKTLVDKAEEEAREVIAVLKDKKLGYVVPTFNYWQSRPLARGQVGEQFDSIQGFWNASFESKIALMANGIEPVKTETIVK